MGWISILLERVIGLLVGKKSSVSKTEVEATRKKIIAARRLYSTKAVIQVNFDLKPSILKLFFLSYWIDGVFFALSVFINVCYNCLFIYHLFDIQIDGIDSNSTNVPWVGGVITVLVTPFFLIRFIRDIYKLSLRGKYRANYLKLLWLDFVTLNLFILIGSIIFWKTKKQVNNLNEDNQNNLQVNFNTESIKLFTKVITKVELLILSFLLIVFVLAFLIGSLVPVNSLRIICFIIIIWPMIFIQAWSITKIFGLIILRKLLNQLMITNDYYLFLTALRFLGLNFYGYYLSVFINVLGFDENYKDFIIQQW